MRTAAISFTLTFLFAPALAAAQLGAGGNALNLILTPEHPRAGSVISLELESYTIDINASTITWMRNGAVAKQGVGEKIFTLTVGPLGSEMVIKVIAQAPDGRVLSQSLSIRPADVELFWQTNAYTHPFYRGKALFPFQGTALIAAVPFFVDGTGRQLTARELVYTWSEDEKVDGPSSGAGRNLYVVQGAVPIREKFVSVEVATPDRSLVAAAVTTITPVEPKLLLYENHPLYGLRFGQALRGSFPLTGEEVRVSAVPFYFETSARNRELSYKWSLNFSPLPRETKPDIVLRRSSERGGRATLSLEAENAEPKTFQAGRISTDFIMEDRLFGSFVQ